MIRFNALDLGGNLPTHAGIVWTDVGRNGGGDGPGSQPVMFSATDSLGNNLGSIGPFYLGDKPITGQTAEDRFLGVYNPSGISSITISMPGSNNWEVDHLQYGNMIEKFEPLEVTNSNDGKQPSLHLTASALGKTSDSSLLELDAPLNVEIDVSFKGYMTQASNSTFYTGYKYHWFRDGAIIQSSEKTELTQKLLPKDEPYDVVLKAEKLENTAQSTPPVYNPNSIKPTIDSSIKVLIKPHPEWNCKGRLGLGCSDGDIINKTATTQYTVVPCNRPEKEKICIESQMSVGAIRHDRCCESTPSLHFCSGYLAQFSKKDWVGSLYKEACEQEWEQAWDDAFDRKSAMFDYIWEYPPSGNRPSEGKHGWWIGLAPSGVVVSREESEPSPTEKAICESREVEPVKTLVTLPVNASYIRGSTIEATVWVCSANKPKTVANKSIPVVKPKVKKVTRTECNKSSSVISSSTGSAQEALNKIKTSTDGCTQ